jgi:hypothetical protein
MITQDKTILTGYHAFFQETEKGDVYCINSSSNTYKYNQKVGCILVAWPFGPAMCCDVRKSEFS